MRIVAGCVCVGGGGGGGYMLVMGIKAVSHVAYRGSCWAGCSEETLNNLSSPPLIQSLANVWKTLNN